MRRITGVAGSASGNRLRTSGIWRHDNLADVVPDFDPTRQFYSHRQGFCRAVDSERRQNEPSRPSRPHVAHDVVSSGHQVRPTIVFGRDAGTAAAETSGR